MAFPRLQVSRRIREAMGYRKLAGPVPRVLILTGEYWLDRACERAARMLGWEAAPVPVRMEGVLPREHVARLFQCLLDFRPDYVLSINMSGMDVDGLFARFFEDLALPLVTWFVDDPRTILMGRRIYASAYSIALTWEASYAGYLAEAGFPVVETLSLAVDPSLFNAEPASSWLHLPTFVGNSMAVPAEREWAWISARPRLAALVRDAFACGRVTREAFASGVDTVLAPGAAATLDSDERRHAELYFFVEGTRRLREQFIRCLAPEGVEVRGDEGWAQCMPGAHAGVNYSHELPAFYRDCAINLNTTSLQMATAVNQRVFDCPAAGGFLLTDAQPALGELFDVERELAVYRTTEEAVELLRWYRARPRARQDQTRRARARILNEHTYAHRLRRITDLVRARFGG